MKTERVNSYGWESEEKSKVTPLEEVTVQGFTVEPGVTQSAARHTNAAATIPLILLGNETTTILDRHGGYRMLVLTKDMLLAKYRLRKLAETSDGILVVWGQTTFLSQANFEPNGRKHSERARFPLVRMTAKKR